MDYERLSPSRVDFSRFEPEPPPQHILANVVIIDRAPGDIYPLAYQFQHDIDYSDENLASIEHNFKNMDSDAFLVLGYVDTINKQKRHVILKNDTTVHYKHLIVISPKNESLIGSLSRQQKFCSALHTLIDALRTKKSITPEAIVMFFPTEDFEPQQVNFHTDNPDRGMDPILPSHVKKVFSTQIVNVPYGVLYSHHSPSGKCLYELQI